VLLGAGNVLVGEQADADPRHVDAVKEVLDLRPHVILPVLRNIATNTCQISALA
jgi:hypothetical protein